MGADITYFYNQFQIGTLEVSADVRYKEHNCDVDIEIELRFARLLPFHQISNLLSWIVPLTTSASKSDINVVLHHAMLNQLRQIEYDYEIDDRSSGGWLNVSFSGSAANYLKRT